MSMNLYCKGVKLLQTPTDVTLWILSHDRYGQPKGGWEGCANRYLEWLVSERAKYARTPTIWYTSPEWEMWTEKIDNFKDVVEKAKADRRPLQFSKG